MDNPRIHGALRPRVREWILACSPSRAPRYPLCGPRGVELMRDYVGTCMYSIGLRIKEPSSHMAPKRSPYSPFLPFALVPLRFPFLLRSTSFLLSLCLPSLALHLSHPNSLSLSLSLAPLRRPLPLRTLQFSNGFVLADYVSLPTYVLCCKVCTCVRMRQDVHTT